MSSWQRFWELYDQMLKTGHRGEVLRELRDEEDVFMILMCSEMLGLPNPVHFYTLEVYPVMLERFHEWHQRMGMERSPLEHIRCC